MKLLLENWRRYLKEVNFHTSDDFDIPGKNQLIVFAPDEEYKEEGQTHGVVSHAIKHYHEFKPQETSAALQQALKRAAEFDNFFVKSTKTGSPLAQGDEAKKMANENAMLNTFDFINDKMINNEPLSQEEKQLVPLISVLHKKYEQLVDSYLSRAVDIESETNPAAIKQMFDSGKTVKFIGRFGRGSIMAKETGGKPLQYHLDTSNTAILPYSDGEVTTLFRIDKKGTDLSKVAKYFGRGVEIQNKAIAKVLSSYAGTSAELPQQQQKKQKTQQQKKGPNPKAMAIGMARGGKTPEEIQAQIKKSTGIDISVENIKKMIGT